MGERAVMWAQMQHHVVAAVVFDTCVMPGDDASDHG
jgi:hypothetical protein